MSSSLSSSPSPLSAARGLYDGNGDLLLSLPTSGSVEAKVLGQDCTLQVEGDTLTVTRWGHTDDRDARCRSKVLDRNTELEGRKKMSLL